MKKNRKSEKPAKIISMEEARRRSGRKRPTPSIPEEVKDLYRPAPKPAKNRSQRRGSRKTESLKEHKRGMSIRRSTTFVAGLFFVFVMIYVTLSLFNFFTTPEIPVDMVRIGSIDTPLVVEGIIIRDETIYTAPGGGVLQFSVNHYDRVRPGSEVASIQNVSAVSDIRQSIYHVEEQILRLQDIRGDLSAVDPAIHQINGQIRSMVNNRLSRHIDLNMSEVYSLRDGIVQNVNIRNQMIVAENLLADVRPELGIQHNVLLGELGANRTPIHINGGGIVAPMVDGLEQELTFDTMHYLTREATRLGENQNISVIGQEVESGDEIFRIVNSNRWYIAAYIPNEFIEGLTTGSNTVLYMENRRDPLRVRVRHMDPGFMETFVIFGTSSYMIDFINSRSVFFRTTDTIQDGLRIANTAITERFDEYGDIIQGVYRVNNGIAAFVAINLPEEAAVGSVYSILDPYQNPGLRVYDHIVTDASMVEEGDIVFSGVR